MNPGLLTIVTGTTRGLGSALAQQLATEGGHLVTLGRKPLAGLDKLAKSKGTVLTEILVDLADADSLQKAAIEMSSAISKAGSSSSCRLIHNAGIVAPIDRADQLTELDAIRAAFDVNIAAPIFLTAHFLKATQSCADRRLLLISSGAGRHPFGSWGVYCATKAAMDRYAEVIHAEGHPNTRVCSLAPGVVDTGMQAQIRQTPESRFPAVGRFADMHRQGMLADAASTANVTLKLLASEDFGQKLLDDVRDHAQ